MTAGYFDYNATAPLDDAVREAMLGVLGPPGNPSSVHGFGRKARGLVDEAREAIAARLGAAPDEVVFTSCGTEANALALGKKNSRVIAVSAIEHPSVLENAPTDAARIGVDANGVIDCSALESVLKEHDATDSSPPLIAVMLANNETGVIQPVAAIAEIAARYGAEVHCDAVQGMGKIPVDFASLGVASMAVCAHKIGGPTGVGALILRDRNRIAPLMGGGGQERNVRPGTENLAGIVGFGVAATRADPDAFEKHCRPLQSRLESAITRAAPDAVILGREAERIANTSAITMPGKSAEIQLMGFDLMGIAVSAGSACSSGKIGASHVAEAMGISGGECIRISTGMATSGDDITRLAEAWQVLYKRGA